MSVFLGTMWKMESSIMSVLGYQAKWKAKANWAQVFSSFIFLKTDDKWPSASNSRFHAFHTVAKWPLKLWIKNKNKTFPLLIIFLDALSQNKKLTNPILFLFSKQWYEISWCVFESFLITVYEHPYRRLIKISFCILKFGRFPCIWWDNLRLSLRFK